jgi:hypothetical protein
VAEFKSFVADVEVLGDAIEAFVAGFPPELSKIGSDLLAAKGIDGFRRGEYYPLQSLLDAMKEIQDKFSSEMLFRIGEKIATNAVLPAGIDSLENCLASINTAYHMNHRRGEIGSYEYTYLGEAGGLKRAKMTCPNPYPCAFDRGVIHGFAQRFKPSGAVDVIVRHDESGPCRRTGANACTYLISWV